MKRVYPVIDNESATLDYAKKLMGFQEILGRLRVPQQAQETIAGSPLDSALMQQGQPTHFATKLGHARKLGMNNYTGTPEQDGQLAIGLDLQLKNDQGRRQQELDSKKSEREFGLKEKELKIKEQELSATKTPTADEIASAIISKSNT